MAPPRGNAGPPAPGGGVHRRAVTRGVAASSGRCSRSGDGGASCRACFGSRACTWASCSGRVVARRLRQSTTLSTAPALRPRTAAGAGPQPGPAGMSPVRSESWNARSCSCVACTTGPPRSDTVHHALGRTADHPRNWHRRRPCVPLVHDATTSRLVRACCAGRRPQRPLPRVAPAHVHSSRRRPARGRDPQAVTAAPAWENGGR